MRYYSSRDSNILKRASLGPQVIAAKQLEDWRLGKLKRGGTYLGAVNQQLVSAGGAAGGAIAGATAGSVVPVVGTAIGMVVGAVIGILTKTNNTASHIGSWDASLAQGIQSLPASASGIGRQIPWNENSHGLVQMIEALLAVGVYMAWDTSLKSSYDVCAHWAMTFGAAVQSLTNAIVANPVGPCSVTISESPGANRGPIQFNFQNPGIGVGPDAIAANIIMGTNGLMYSMITGLGETTAHASSNAYNGLAQKVYALMVDNIAATLVPAVPAAPVPVVAPVVTAAATAANTAVSNGTNPQQAAVTAAQTTVIPAAPTQAPPAAMPSGGVYPGISYSTTAPATVAMSAPAIGYPSAAPAALPPVTAAGFGAGIPSWAIIAIAVVGLGFLFFKQAPVSAPPAV
jgi:hypothetical protein